MDSSKVVSQLDTYTYVVPASGLYDVSAQMHELPPSALSVVIQLNGSTKASSAAPAASQAVLDLQVRSLKCAASDTISFIISSSQASDNALNAVKGILNIHPFSLS